MTKYQRLLTPDEQKAVERRWCHASCCCGETEITGPWGEHDAQLWLDAAGLGGSSYFGNDHDTVLALLVAAYEHRGPEEETWP